MILTNKFYGIKNLVNKDNRKSVGEGVFLQEGGRWGRIIKF